MLQNLHTHCRFCDGRDTAEEMIERAIELGFDSLGFSSHAQTEIHSGCEIKDVDEYFNTISALKKKYEGQIKILLGCELDYYSPGYMPQMDFDYTIGSVHFAKLPDGRRVTYDHSYDWAKGHLDRDLGGDGLAYARLYFEAVADLPRQLGDFDIVGHFDLLTKYSEQHPEFIDVDSKAYRNIALEALHAIREKKEIFEVNTGAISRGYRVTPYPAPFILDEMRRLDCKLVLSSDCHDRRYLDCHFNEARELMRAHGFDTIYYLAEKGNFVGEKL